MQFQHATFARSGRSVRIADPASPYEMTLVWACCFYMQRHADMWAATVGKRRYDQRRFERLNAEFIGAMLGGGAASRTHYVQRVGQGDVFLELARDIESRSQATPYLSTPRQFVWFSRRNAYSFCEVTGFTRGMATVEEFVEALNRALMSFYNVDAATSFAKRTEPHLDLLRNCGTQAALYAADLIELLAHWDVQGDGALVLTP